MKYLFFFFLTFSITTLHAQEAEVQQIDFSKLKEKEQLLKKIGSVMIYSEVYEERRDANYTFIQQLKEALELENSFAYDFPELSFVQFTRTTDNSFRVITWQIEMQGQLIRHFGTIQMNSEELKLFPLIDRSDDMETPEKFVGDNQKWYGALYYEVVAMYVKGHKKYLLIGIDSNNPFSTKKVIDVLQFNGKGEPVLGAPIFSNWKRPFELATRFIVEYKGNASVSMKFDNQKRKIIYDHLVPLHPKNDEGIYMNYVPDGTFDALTWQNDRFIIEHNVVPTNYEEMENELRQNSGTAKSNSIYNPNKK